MTINNVKEILEKLIKLYKSNSKLVDHIFCEKINYEINISTNF